MTPNQIADAQGPRWRELTAEERQVQYSPSSCTGGTFEPYIAEYAERSLTVRERFANQGPPLQELRYGPGDSNTVDLVVPGTSGPCPLLVFIHGGYWQRLSKRESLFAAQDCLDAGVAFAAVDYTLAPEASLDQIVAECHAAVAALRAGASAIGIDPERIVVCGSSAGAHLSAMVGLGSPDGWRPAGLGLLSGVFELEPLIGTTINEAVGLDVEAAQRNSPLLADLTDFPPTVVAWGDNETDEFKRQSLGMAGAIAKTGTAVNAFEVPNRNHFDIVFDLANPAEPLGAAMHDLVAAA